jgi:hypothetical protein
MVCNEIRSELKENPMQDSKVLEICQLPPSFPEMALIPLCRTIDTSRYFLNNAVSKGGTRHCPS